ncbi:polysulfide reductase NrfD [Dissulfurirhabdus thermomarina]|uniref:Polysulfide reductase NrfD n=1 Tax=Dissulfurirhabdus thermomarina TaxID=1765737 RepID=A0A6N9TVW9_DISTH|nr:NrfD/PsrC family molybdoenzyme membrane anchor subunit [Dissulfurirhabdus thermomarina]NDY43567.1 polysulfide reductase NrfD [Dissulfurirhabdus thermomarina]NMX24545.1 polysulfide reductase NrfD [Dissulfurirhabdus thermomarina]
MANPISLATTAEPRLATTRFSLATLSMLALLAAGVGAGLYAFVVGHPHAYAVTREVPWGILISTYAFFAITSTGLCLLAAIGHAFGGTPLAPLGNRAVYLSIVTILSGFLVIGLELESPWRMAIYNVISPNLSSNIWWMGTLYGLAVGCMFVEFFAILTGRWGVALAIGGLGALAEVGANTNLGAVFATLSARPFWYGAQLPVYFLCSAVMCGAAAIILFTHVSYRMRGEAVTGDTYRGLQSAGKILALTAFLIVVATAWRFISFFTGGSDSARLAVSHLLSGPLATNFWLFENVVGLVLPLVLLVGTRMQSVPAMSAASLMVLVGAFFQRYDLVVAGQQVPVWYGWDDLPSYMGYAPSPVELLVVLGGIGLTGAGFLLGERFFGRVFGQGHH